MAQADGVVANGTGAAVRSDLNGQLAALFTNHSGSTEPATTYAYQWWADTNANVLKIRNSANNAWITLRELDGTMLIEDGSASTPGLSFASDTNTGFFSGGADKIGFATGGTERLEIGSSEVVFNDPSNDVDFRVESNGQTHMLFVDAGNDRIGVGTSSPAYQLHVAGSSPKIASQDSDGTNQITEIFNSDGSTYLRSQNNTTNGIIFFQQSDGTTITTPATIGSSGNFGIGTTSPSTKLHLEGTDLNFITLSHATRTGSWRIEHSGTNSEFLAFLQDNGSSDVTSYLAGRDEHRFHTAGSERLRLNQQGRLFLGSTTFTSNNTVRFDMSFAGGGTEYGIAMNAGSLLAGTQYIAFNIGTTQYGSISWNGSAMAYNTSSDYRLKENIVSLTGGIDRIKQLQVRRFNFIATPGVTVDGFVAHEAQTVVPEAVTGTQDEVEVWKEGQELPEGVSVGDNKLDEDGNTIPVYQGIDQSKLVPLLTAALQEAIAKIETLETKVAALEANS